MSNETLPDLAGGSNSSEQPTAEKFNSSPNFEQEKDNSARGNLPSKTALKARITAAWATALVMLPILAVGTATYYFGSQGIDQQTILTRRADNTGIAEAELARQKQLLAFLLIGTGTTALLAGLLAALWTSRTIRLAVAAGAEEKARQEQEKSSQPWQEFIRHRSHSLNREDLLEATVVEARHILNCDRAVVYSLNQDNYGVVVAESVAPGWTRALGLTIEDPCFEARYLDQYRDGRVRAVNNIYEADVPPCYLEQLEKLEVKANLVTPILNEGELFGLLVAHHCAAPRTWQAEEIEFLTQLAKRLGLALDNAKLLAEATQLKQQAATEAQWTQLFTDAVRYIRQSLQQEDILDISVEEVRRVLNCDRVVVYSLNQERYGVVVAESVAPGWTRALGRTIQDPCFEARYLDQYRDGRVRALDNIYAAGMTSCYLEQLAQLEVQANLVTPILNEGKLFGLLVAHHCAAPRVWQQPEIRWVTQIATQVGFALDNSKLLRQIATESRLTQSLKNFTLGLRERFNQKELLKIAVEEARRAINSDRVIVYSFDEHWQGKAIAESILPGLPKALGANINDPCFARDYAEKYRRGRIQTIDNIDEAELTDCYRQQLAKFAVKASLVAPIVQGDRLFGLLIAHQCSNSRHWQQAEVDLFAQLAVQVGLALDRAILLSGVTHATSQMLQESQNALENLSAEVNRQSEAITDFLKQVQAITNCDREITITATPAEYLERSSQTANLDSNQVTLKENIATVRETIAKAAEKVKQLKQSSEKLVQMGHLIDELRNQREGQGTDGASDLSQVKQSSQSSLVSFAETVHPLTHRLAKQTEQIEALMGEIALETNKVLDEPDSNTSQVFVEIEPTTPVNIEMNAIAGKIARATEQTQNLAFINQFILQIAALANQISAQSAAVTESFDKLAALTQKLPGDDR